MAISKIEQTVIGTQSRKKSLDDLRKAMDWIRASEIKPVLMPIPTTTFAQKPNFWFSPRISQTGITAIAMFEIVDIPANP